MTKNEAQETIRDHLDRKGRHAVKVTEHLIRYWWRICNVALFEGNLYPPNQIVVKPLKDWGYCQVSNHEITIALDSGIPTRDVFLSTLIHEMVHQWEQQTYGRMGHGKRYEQWKKSVSKQIGLDIHSDIEEDCAHGERLYKRRY